MIWTNGANREDLPEFTIGETAVELGVDVKTVRDLLRHKGLRTGKSKRNGMAKMVGPETMRVMRIALSRVEETK